MCERDAFGVSLTPSGHERERAFGTVPVFGSSVVDPTVQNEPRAETITVIPMFSLFVTMSALVLEFPGGIELFLVLLLAILVVLYGLYTVYNLSNYLGDIFRR